MEEGHGGAALGVPRVESSNLRELLKVREGDPVRALAGERREAPPSFAAAAGMAVASRTLLDVIKDEDDPSRLAPGGGIRGVNWKAFKDRLKLRRATSVWSPSYPDEVAVGPGSPRPISIVHGTSALHLPTFASRMECKPQEPAAEAAGQQEEPTGVSLMALLEQQERSGPSFAATVMGLVGDEDEDDDCGGDASAASEGKEMCVCCVCMVRHKGAAFIPCGHTFCRLCSRELWVSRGNCPLCNGYIQEILDIF